ncbi:hypothetical protein A2U01_0059385, partial [Trifolium medium]|nr:hypothetical protein [Trifolium medium]
MRCRKIQIWPYQVRNPFFLQFFIPSPGVCRDGSEMQRAVPSAKPGVALTLLICGTPGLTVATSHSSVAHR